MIDFLKNLSYNTTSVLHSPGQLCGSRLCVLLVGVGQAEGIETTVHADPTGRRRLSSFPALLGPSLPCWLDAYLVKLEEALKEATWVLQQPFAWLPVVIYFGAWLVSSHLLWLDTLHDAHSFYD